VNDDHRSGIAGAQVSSKPTTLQTSTGFALPFTLAGGIVGALLAAVPGLFDLLGLEDQRARRIGAMHMGLNLLIVAAMAVNVWLRTRGTPASALPYVISAMAVVALLVSGWLGGHLVHVLGVTQPKDARVGHRAGEGSPRRAT